MSRVRRLGDEIDWHVVALLMFIAPLVALGWWWLVVPLLVPQGRILTRAFGDYPAFGERPWAYLVANELVVLVVVTGSIAIRAARFGII